MPLRIVSLAPSNTEILYSIGLGDSIAGVTRFCDWPREAAAKPRVGGWLDVSEKALRELEPDVAVTSTFMQDKVVERLEAMKLAVVHVDPSTLEGVYESMLTLGKAFGKEYEAEQLVGQMQARIGKIRSFTRREAVRVYVEEWHKPPTVSGNWVPELIEAAGGIGIAQPGERSRPVALQEVSTFNPEHVVLTWCGFGSHDKEKIIAELKKRDSWALMRAVMKDNVYALDDSLLNRPGPRLADGCEAMARILHPEAFR